MGCDEIKMGSFAADAVDKQGEESNASSGISPISNIGSGSDPLLLFCPS
jgi:hypothetical protein